MARYRHIDMSPRLLPVDLQAQLVPGSFAHTLHHVVDQLDLSAFDAHYRNDESGAPAHAPTMLLKAVLLAYSQGMVSSRSIEWACRDNMLFIALTGDAKPHFTTITDFVNRSREAIAAVFAQVLTLLDGEGLIGPESDISALIARLPRQVKPTFHNATPHKTPRRATKFSCRRSGRLSIRERAFSTASTLELSGARLFRASAWTIG
jgi:transposase